MKENDKKISEDFKKKKKKKKKKFRVGREHKKKNWKSVILFPGGLFGLESAASLTKYSINNGLTYMYTSAGAEIYRHKDGLALTANHRSEGDYIMQTQA